MLTAKNDATEATSDEYVSGKGRVLTFWLFLADAVVAGLTGARGQRLGALVASVAAVALDPAMSWWYRHSSIGGCVAAVEQLILPVVEPQNRAFLGQNQAGRR